MSKLKIEKSILIRHMWKYRQYIYFQHFNLERVVVFTFIMEDRLTEIGVEDLKRLRDLYTPDGVKSYATFVTIDTYLRWNEQDRIANDENIKFFCLKWRYFWWNICDHRKFYWNCWNS